MEMNNEEIKGYEEILEVYRKYFLPTMKEKYPAKSRVIKSVKSTAKVLGCKLISEEPLSMTTSVYNKIARSFKNRYLEFFNEGYFYKKSELADIFGMTESGFRNFARTLKLEIATIISNEFFYYKSEVNELRDFKNSIYSINQVSEIIEEEYKMKVPEALIRAYSKNIGIYITDKTARDRMCIRKENLNLLIEEIKNNYRPKKFYKYPKYVKKIQTKCIFQYISEEVSTEWIELRNVYEKLDLKEDIRFNKYEKFRNFIINEVAKEKIKLWLRKEKSNIFSIYMNLKDINYLIEREIHFCKLNNNQKKVISKEEEIYIIKNLYEKNIAIKKIGASVYNKLESFLYYKNGQTYIEKNIVDKIENFKNISISISKFMLELDKVSRQRIINIIKKENIKIIEDIEGVNVFKGQRILKNDAERIKKIIKNEELEYKDNIYEQYEYSTSENLNNVNLKNTNKYYEIFRMQRMKKNQSRQLTNSLIRVYILLNEKLDKEIVECTDLDIRKLLVEPSLSRGDLNELIRFIKNCKKYGAKYDKNYLIKRECENSVQAYTKIQWRRFGKILFDVKDKEFKIRLEKALKFRGEASIWLFCCMNYVACWRTSDILAIPFPNIELLGVNENELKRIIKEDCFTLKMAQILVNNVKMKIDANEQLPLKTKRRNRTPLKFIINSSYTYVLGLLLAICEIHRRESNSKKDTLINSLAGRIDRHNKFFGYIYIEIFGEKGFSNLRANKTYEKEVVIQSQKQGWGCGLQLASIGRSHKVNSNFYSDTTEAYLKDVNKDGDVDEIVRAIFERGIMGFIPYNLLLLMHGIKIKKLEMKNQNKLLREIGLNSRQIEKIVKVSEENILYHTKFLDDINKYTDLEIKDMLLKICMGMAPATEEYCQCLLKCLDKQCTKKGTNICIGCEFSIPEIYMLNKLGDLIKKNIENIESSDNVFEVKRDCNVLVRNYMRVLNNAIEVIGKERISSFIDIGLLKNRVKEVIKKYKNMEN